MSAETSLRIDENSLILPEAVTKSIKQDLRKERQLSTFGAKNALDTVDEENKSPTKTPNWDRKQPIDEAHSSKSLIDAHQMNLIPPSTTTLRLPENLSPAASSV